MRMTILPLDFLFIMFKSSPNGHWLIKTMSIAFHSATNPALISYFKLP